MASEGRTEEEESGKSRSGVGEEGDGKCGRGLVVLACAGSKGLRDCSFSFVSVFAFLSWLVVLQDVVLFLEDSCGWLILSGTTEWKTGKDVKENLKHTNTKSYQGGQGKKALKLFLATATMQ